MADRIAEFEESFRELDNSLRRADRRGKNLVKCMACKRDYPMKIAELTGEFCVTCYLDVEFGVVPAFQYSLLAGSPTYYWSSDDDPALHNAVRAIEDASD